MNPEIKQKWVAALRSGEYQQGKHRLHSIGGKFCCQGVLTDLRVKAEGLAWGRERALDGRRICWSDDTVAWAGISDPDVEVEINGTVAPLWEHNDTGRTFAEIANAIEEQL